MARFRYSMQNILDVKMKMETQARQEFSAARNALDKEERKLLELQQRKEAYESRAKQLRTGILSVRELEENKNAIRVVEEYILAQMQQVKRTEDYLEQSRQALEEVIKERKTHEILKERAFEEFLREENRQESKVVDELTSYTYGQSRQEND
ncbi:MAG: flagellar export protein FliJ [Acetatifactor sp.]|nr:flagellar export protein FliJ [Acetatifactor sp.]